MRISKLILFVKTIIDGSERWERSACGCCENFCWQGWTFGNSFSWQGIPRSRNHVWLCFPLSICFWCMFRGLMWNLKFMHLTWMLLQLLTYIPSVAIGVLFWNFSIQGKDGTCIYDKIQGRDGTWSLSTMWLSISIWRHRVREFLVCISGRKVKPYQFGTPWSIDLDNQGSMWKIWTALRKWGY